MNDLRQRRSDRTPVRSRRDTARTAEAIAAVRQLDWRQFVHLVAEAYRTHGYQATVTGDRSDHGVDLVLRRASRTFLVQCKQWRSYTVDREAVRALYGQVMAQHASGGVLLATGTVQPDAQAFADWAGIQLVDGPAIHELIHRGRLPGPARSRARAKPEAKDQLTDPDIRELVEQAPTGYASQAEAFAAHLRPHRQTTPSRRSTLVGLSVVAAIVAGIGFTMSGMGLLSTPARPGIAAGPAGQRAAETVLQLDGRPVAIAVDSAAERGYVADFDAGEVVMIDLATMTKVGRLHAHGRPNAIAVDPDRQVLWLTDFNSARVVAVDLETGQKVAGVDVARQPDYLAIDPARNRLYVSSRSTGELQVINTKSAKKLKSHRTESSAALAVDSDNRLLYVSERETGRIKVYDLETKKWETSASREVPVTGMAVDGEQQRLYTIGDGDWVEEADLVARVTERHPLAVPARAIAIDAGRGLGYVLDPEAGTLHSFTLG